VKVIAQFAQNYNAGRTTCANTIPAIAALFFCDGQDLLGLMINDYLFAFSSLHLYR
jgi:hypothetical protein